MKKLCAILLALCLSCSVALAEEYAGVTEAVSETAVFAEGGGIAEEICVRVGEQTKAGDTLLRLRTVPVFATQDGTVASLHAQAGDDVSGTVLELLPQEKYTIYCTADEAYSAPETMLVASGETVYMKCTKDGSHRGTGIVTTVSGSEYTVLALGGEFHVGEVVEIFRDSAFSKKQRIGKGTVVATDPETYTGTGTLARVCVAEGEFVERGELLYTLSDGESDIVSPVSGIVTAISAAQGQSVMRDSAVLTVVPDSKVCCVISVDEETAAKLSAGDAAKIIPASDPQETEIPATVLSVSRIPREDGYAVRVMPCEETFLPIGETVRVKVLTDK